MQKDESLIVMSISGLHFKARYLANAITPAVTVLIRAVRADHKVQGYQIAAYIDRATSRLQVIYANLAESDHWRICADGVMLSNHKLMVKTLIRWDEMGLKQLWEVCVMPKILTDVNFS